MSFNLHEITRLGNATLYIIDNDVPFCPLLCLYIQWYNGHRVILLAVGVASLWVEPLSHPGHAHLGRVECVAAVKVYWVSRDALAQRSLSLPLPSPSYRPWEILVTIRDQLGAQLEQDR